MTTQSNSLRIATSVATEPYAWPGGYPRYAICDDGGALCPRCCATERKEIATTTGHDGWCVIAADINWEDSDLYCDHCNSQIESAYSDD